MVIPGPARTCAAKRVAMNRCGCMAKARFSNEVRGNDDILRRRETADI